MQDTILLITADASLTAALRDEVGGRACRIITSAAKTAVSVLYHKRPTLVLLDTDGCSPRGLDLCRQLRAASAVPLILLSSDADEVDRILGFELGADDYITKPCSMREVGYRVRALLRVAHLNLMEADEPREAIAIGTIVIDPVRRRVTKAGQPLALPPRLYQLLWFFATHPWHVYSPEEILSYVWGNDAAHNRQTVAVSIRLLRERIEEDPAHPRYLRTHVRHGYFLDIPDSAARKAQAS